MVAAETSGANQRRNGPMKRDVCSAESKSVEPRKMKIIQARGGSQYLRNADTADETTRRMLVLTPQNANCRASRAARKYSGVAETVTNVQARPHSAACLRASFHGARLGRPAAGFALRKT